MVQGVVIVTTAVTVTMATVRLTAAWFQMVRATARNANFVAFAGPCLRALRALRALHMQRC